MRLVQTTGAVIFCLLSLWASAAVADWSCNCDCCQGSQTCSPVFIGGFQVSSCFNCTVATCQSYFPAKCSIAIPGAGQVSTSCSMGDAAETASTSTVVGFVLAAALALALQRASAA